MENKLKKASEKYTEAVTAICQLRQCADDKNLVNALEAVEELYLLHCCGLILTEDLKEGLKEGSIKIPPFVQGVH